MPDPITDNLNTDIAIASAVRTLLTTPAILTVFNDAIAAAVKQQVDLALAAAVDEMLHADNISNAIRDELEGEPRWFRSTVENIIENHIDTDEIADEAKSKVIENLDLDELNIEDKVNEIIDNRDTALSDDDIDRIATRVCKVIVIQPYNKSFM
jgi:hypothetical protein